MDFLALAQSRYSVRAYEQRPVEAEKLSRILEAGRIAPTAANKQPQRFLVLNTPEGLQKLATGTNSHGAPLAIVVLGDRSAVWVRPYDKKDMIDIDTAIATDHMMLEAVSLGLGTCWLTYFDPEVIRGVFKIPSNLIPVNILTMGYAKGTPSSPERFDRDRKPMKDFVVYGSF
jgi:nitroreductase